MADIPSPDWNPVSLDSNVGYNPMDCNDPTPATDEHVQYGRLLIKKQIQEIFPTIDWPPTGDNRPIVPVGERPVGIIGAGVGGLYAAMMLQSLGIPFEILEASARTGGRIFTYSFCNAKHCCTTDRCCRAEKCCHPCNDYFDVGATRYPCIPMMRRLFHLFCLPELHPRVITHLTPYIMRSSNTFLMYNNIRYRADELDPEPRDAFHFGISKGGNVPEEFIDTGYGPLYNEAVSGFATAIQDNFHSGWKRMMRFDEHSVRGYMSNHMKLPQSAINWCETRRGNTGVFDLGLSQTVLNGLPKAKADEWYSLRGGSQVLTDAMTAYLEKRGALYRNKVVRGIHSRPKGDAIDVTVAGERAPRSFGHVISTVAVPCLRTFDLDNCLLSFDQRNAIRMSQYDSGAKIGIKFKSAWWRTWNDLEGKALNIVGGHSFTDRTLRIIVYPSSESTTVLVASYTSSRDATLLGGLIGTADQRLKELILRDLAAIHNVKYTDLENEYVAHFGHEWTSDPLSHGAFAFFGPGQFSTLYLALTHPSIDGRLHFAGEAASVRHAWVVGALDASWKAVKEILDLSYHDKLFEFYRRWGINGEWATDDESSGTDRGDLSLKYEMACNPELFGLPKGDPGIRETY